jgi:peptidoglycan hydrolase-like protein with peptidoglycan-binding domain
LNGLTSRTFLSGADALSAAFRSRLGVHELGTFGKSSGSASNSTETNMKTMILALSIAGALTSAAVAQSIGRADGRWGNETQNAVKRFQQSKQLRATGQLDQQTVADLGLDSSKFSQSRGMQK